MVKIIFCLRRRPELSLAEFQRYWRERHAPLVASRAKVLGIRRYVQSHRLDDPRLTALAEARDTEVAPYDGVAELWFDSAEVLAGASGPVPEDAAAAARALLEDERTFIDLANSPIFVVEEREVNVSEPAGQPDARSESRA